MALPSLDEAAADPAGAACTLQQLVKLSLSETWRDQHAEDGFLDQLADLFEANLKELRGAATGGKDAEEDDHEDVCAACLKLARNLCVGRPHAQSHWRRRSAVELLAPHLRGDIARPRGERGQQWRDAVPSFLANLVAGNSEMRVHVARALFPHGLAAVFDLCWSKPHLAFVLAQNLLAADDEGTPSDAEDRIVSTADGHCLLLVLVSLLRGQCPDGSEPSAADRQAKEWATVFFSGLWSRGGFPRAYKGLRSLSAQQVQVFLARIPQLGGDCQSEETSAAALAGFAVKLSTPPEVLAFMWHSLHGLIEGDGISQEGAEEPPAAVPADRCEAPLVRALLGDQEFACLAAEEMASACASLAAQRSLPWRPEPPPAEACVFLGVPPCDADAAELCVRACGWSDGAGGVSAPDGCEEASACAWSAGEAGSFGHLVLALIALSLAPQTVGVGLPSALIAGLLAASSSMIDALHRLRFGEDAMESAQRTAPSQEAQDASRDCLLVDLVRLSGNLLHGHRGAQDFARSSGCLRTLLSHCYADYELPMLREAGIFAVRVATQGNPASQDAVEQMLAKRPRTDESGNAGADPSGVMLSRGDGEADDARAGSGPRVEDARAPALAEFGFDV